MHILKKSLQILNKSLNQSLQRNRPFLSYKLISNYKYRHYHVINDVYYFNI
jgi:hypothetical protein